MGDDVFPNVGDDTELTATIQGRSSFKWKAPRLSGTPLDDVTVYIGETEYVFDASVAFKGKQRNYGIEDYTGVSIDTDGQVTISPVDVNEGVYDVEITCENNDGQGVGITFELTALEPEPYWDEEDLPALTTAGVMRVGTIENFVWRYWSGCAE